MIYGPIFKFMVYEVNLCLNAYIGLQIYVGWGNFKCQNVYFVNSPYQIWIFMQKSINTASKPGFPIPYKRFNLYICAYRKFICHKVLEILGLLI